MLFARDAPRWPLRHALRFLDRRDVARLVVCALERGDASLAQWLLHSPDAIASIVDESHCLHVAVAEGCWCAALTLALSLRRARLRVHAATDKARASYLRHKSLFARVVALLETLPFVFPADVVDRAAARGELATLQWLHRASGFKPDEAMRHAAAACQFDALEWLVEQSDGATIALSFAASGSLEAVCWSYHDWFTNASVLCAVTKAHGLRETRTYVDRSMKTNDTACYPLADAFAACGDFVALETVLTLPECQRFFTRATIVTAAAAGHLHVVQWLVARDVRQWSLVEATATAARHGHLEVVQWLFQFPETHENFILHQAIEAGQLETCRWLWHALTPRTSRAGVLPPSFPLCKAACVSPNPAMLAFVHDECGVEFSPMAVQAMGTHVTRCHVAFVLDKLVFARVGVSTALLERVALSGTLDALVFMIDDRRLWSRSLLVQAARSMINPLDKVQFVLDRAAVRASDMARPRTEVLDLDVQDLVGVLMTGHFDVATWLLQQIPENENPSAFGDVDAHKPALHPDHLPHTRDDLISPPPAVAATVAQINAFIEAFITQRPLATKRIPWMPELAVRIDSVLAFQQLEAIGHPEIYSDGTQSAIVKYSRNPRFMLQLLAVNTQCRCDRRTTQWAAKYALISVLTVLCRQATEVGGPEPRQAFVRTAVASAAAAGHVDVLDWVWGTACDALGVARASMTDCVEGTIGEHRHVIRWFDDHQRILKHGCE